MQGLARDTHILLYIYETFAQDDHNPHHIFFFFFLWTALYCVKINIWMQNLKKKLCCVCCKLSLALWFNLKTNLYFIYYIIILIIQKKNIRFIFFYSTRLNFFLYEWTTKKAKFIIQEKKFVSRLSFLSKFPFLCCVVLCCVCGGLLFVFMCAIAAAAVSVFSTPNSKKFDFK